jgi:hypothetical protein
VSITLKKTLFTFYFNTINIFYSSIINNWIGTQVSHLETSSPKIILIQGWLGLEYKITENPQN